MLPWYFKDEIVKREQDYLQQGGKLVFTVDSVDAPNPVLRNVITTQLTQQLQKVSSLENLPFGVHLDGVQVTQNGLDVVASARQVPMPGI